MTLLMVSHNMLLEIILYNTFLPYKLFPNDVRKMLHPIKMMANTYTNWPSLILTGADFSYHWDMFSIPEGKG